MTTTVFDGIDARDIRTDRLTARVLERPATTDPAGTVVLVHGNVSSSLFWQPLMLALPADLRVVAIDLRGFGGSEALPVDASRGVRDFSDDVAAVLDALEIDRATVVGWSLGGGVVMQLTLDRPDLVAAAVWESPVSPYGFGGTAADGSLLTPDGAGTGGGGANPDFVARLQAGDTSTDAATSPRTVYRTAYVAVPAAVGHEDVWVASMLTTVTGVDNYPGDARDSAAWPGFGAGTRGVLNTLAPTNFDLSGIADATEKPPVLWIRGTADAIVSDTSFFDLNHLGAIGAVPGWPGADIAPAQPMVTQTRDVLERYAANGGRYREIAYEGVGHAPHLERPAEFAAEVAALAAEVAAARR